jgi:hypothetical protein
MHPQDPEEAGAELEHTSNTHPTHIQHTSTCTLKTPRKLVRN